MSNEQLIQMKRDAIDDCLGRLYLALDEVKDFDEFDTLATMIQYCIDRAKYDQGRI
jgi:hypothetical protein